MSEGDLSVWTVLFGGGADLRSSRAQIPDRRGINYLNVVLDDYGGVMKRPGSLEVKSFGTSTTRVISATMWALTPGMAPVHVVHLSDGTVVKSTDLVTYTQILSGVSGTDPFCFIGGVGSGTNKLFFTNITNGMYSWDGIAGSPTAIVGAPAAKWITWWKDTLWAGNTSSLKSRVYSSAPGNGDSWPGVNFVDIARGDGDEVRGFWPDNAVLVVGKLRRLFAIEDPTTFRNRIIDPDKGIEGHWTWMSSDDGVYFLSRKGVARLQLQAPSEIVSRNIEPVFTPQVLNFNRLGTVWAFKHADSIGWSVPEAGSDVPTLQLVFYPGLQERPWTFHRGPWRTFNTWRSGTEEKLLSGSTKANKVLQAFAKVGTDDGVPFEGVAESAPINLNKPDIIKYLSHLSLVGRGKVNVSFKRNYEDVRSKLMVADMVAGIQDLWGSGEKWNEGTWGPRSTYSEHILHPDLYFENVVIELRDQSTDFGQDRISVGDVPYILGESRYGAWAVHKIDLRCVEMGMVDHMTRIITQSA